MLSMMLADKIIRLRKKNGWSQEELADKMNVSRQAVSKWESAQSVPDLEKILQLGALFGVTTDYLLKDEPEGDAFTDDAPDTSVRTIGMEEADAYLNLRKRASRKIALGAFLCILSPIALFFCGAMSDLPEPLLKETTAMALGLGMLFVFVLCAVPLFVHCGFQNEPYAFLDANVPFTLEYGVRGMLIERKKNFQKKYVRCNILATMLCIVSVLPLLIIGSLTENELLLVAMLALLMLIAGVAAAIFIVVGIQHASIQRLLQEGEFTKKEKARTGVREVVGLSYWGVLTAVFLVVSFLTNAWHLSWLIFAVGGVLFPVVMCICNYFADRNKQD